MGVVLLGRLVEGLCCVTIASLTTLKCPCWGEQSRKKNCKKDKQEKEQEREEEEEEEEEEGTGNKPKEGRT